MKTQKVEIEVPFFEGFECIGYRIPARGEYYKHFDEDVIFKADNNLKCYSKRFIYRKLPQIKWVDTKDYDFSKHKWGEMIEAAFKDKDNKIWHNGFLAGIIKTDKEIVCIIDCGTFYTSCKIRVEE